MQQYDILYDSEVNLGGKPLVDVNYFSPSVVDCNSREEFVSAIRKSGFLGIGALARRLKFDENVRGCITLSQLLEHWGVNYVDVILDELKRMGWTKDFLKELIMKTPTYDISDFNEIVEVLFESEAFCIKYAEVSWMFFSDVAIFKLLEIDFAPLLKKKKLLKYLG